ncbi:nitric oxide synthase, salivary gland-like [Centruroides vittatus]|uniref:nitric oxide synthase, salivary gland-like n=1 Tax=Centruroides vittatus TaxID=120091 RepID=UPI00350F2B9B
MSTNKTPIRLSNVVTGQISTDILYQQSSEKVDCKENVCKGSFMRTASTSKVRTKEEIAEHAKQFLEVYFSSTKRCNSEVHQKRLKEVLEEISQTGTYELKETELIYGAKLAWRNAPRCIGRIQWSKLQLFDARYAMSAEDMFAAVCNHLKYSTNKGNIRSTITVFAPRKEGKADFRIWNNQILSYAGYVQSDGSVIGDPANIEITKICEDLGWKGEGGRWDVLPLLVSANGEDPVYFKIPEELILRVPITHPNYEGINELNLQWFAVPIVSNISLDVGGIEFPACPFNGWFMESEIARDLVDEHRYNILEDVALKMGLKTISSSTLWKDRAFVELNFAILHSYQKANVTIVDHHYASESFMKHLAKEQTLRGGCPADWVWIIPPLSGSITPVFHQEMLNYKLRPSYEYQEPAWKSHVWEKDGSGDKSQIPRKKTLFKTITSAVKFTSDLYGKALSRRIKATILFATETGKSEQYAKSLTNIFMHAFNAKMMCMSNYDLTELEHETLLLIIASTFGNGDPPENGEEFLKHLQSLQTTDNSDGDFENGESSNVADFEVGLLSNIRFAVFGLGSSAYPKFSQFGKIVDNLLEKLGGERILKLTTGDELCGQEYCFRNWAKEVFQEACEVFCIGEDVDMKNATQSLKSSNTWSPEKIRLQSIKLSKIDILKAISKGTNRKLSTCSIKDVTFLTPDLDERQTILVKINNDQSELSFYPGDHIGIYPVNRKKLVEGILDKMKTTCPDPQTVYQVENLEVVQSLLGVKEKWVKNEKFVPCSIYMALSRLLDITTPPSQHLLGLFATLATSEEDKTKLESLSKNTEQYEDWKAYYYPNILDVLELFPSIVITPAFVLTQFLPLQPRFYSISSSEDFTPREIHATVAVIKFKTQKGNGPLHYGVCSNYLATTDKSTEVICFIRSAPNFHIPADKTVPIIMVGPGTGIAPFRSFWQQRNSEKERAPATEKFGSMILFAGYRHPDVELYSNEIKLMKEIGVLKDVFTAYSRLPKQPKCYVQDIIQQMSATIYHLVIREKCHFYVCGDIIMARDVRDTLITIIRQHEGLPQKEAEMLMIKMQKENRYHEDIFGVTLKTEEITKKGREEARLNLVI